jgi:competence protein ComEA
MRFASQQETEPVQQSEALPPGQQSVAEKAEVKAGAEGKTLVPGEAFATGTAAHFERTAFALTFRDQLVVAAVAVVAISVCSFFYLSSRHVEPALDRLPTSLPSVRWEIDINSATWRELAVMRGVGPFLARQIIEDRKSNGPFESVENLQRVPGIGPRTIEKNRERLRASSTTDIPRLEKPRKDSNGTAE